MEFVKEKFGNQVIVGAEVGVAAGTHALDILENMPNVKLLYLVDPYQHYPEWTSTRAQNRCFWPENMGKMRREVKQRLFPFNNRICWIYKKFEECTKKDIVQPLDFVYIDGNHAYEFVKKDIEVARNLVKKGGVVGGHDFRLASHHGEDSEHVTKAVTDYCAKNNVPYGQEGVDWWFINRDVTCDIL